MIGAAEERKRTSVYIAYDEDSTVIYVGITSRGMTRFAEHENGNGWWWDAARIELKHMGNRSTASLMEDALIEELNPVHNTVRPRPQDDRPNRALYVPDTVWFPAYRRARDEIRRGNPMIIVNRLLEAYAEHRLIVLPRTAEPATEAERDAAALDVADLADPERLACAREHQARGLLT